MQILKALECGGAEYINVEPTHAYKLIGKELTFRYSNTVNTHRGRIYGIELVENEEYKDSDIDQDKYDLYIKVEHKHNNETFYSDLDDLDEIILDKD